MVTAPFIIQGINVDLPKVDSAEAAKEEIAENSHSEKPQLEERATEPEKKTDDLSIKLVSEISELSKL